MHLEDVLALLDASLDGLTTVVRMKPAVEVVHDIVITVVEQEGMAHLVTSGIASQRHVEWVDEAVIDSGLAAASRRLGICVLRALV